MRARYTETLLHCPICILVPIFHALCELNHVGPVTSDATTCFSVKCGCARLQHHAPPLLPSSLWGSGEWRGRGSRCAQYKSGSCIPCKRHHCHGHQQEVVCAAVPALVLHCVFCCAVSPDCPPYNTAPSPRTDHHSPTRTTSNSCQP